MNMDVTKIYLESDVKRPIQSSEHFFSFFHSDVKSLVTYPNNKKANFLNNDLLLICMVHIMHKNCNF